MIDPQKQKKALRSSIIDGALSAVMGSLAGGIFLTGFALKVLKATPAQIGLLAALPLFVNLVQLLGSVIIEKTGKTKMLCLFGVVTSRSLWLVIILLPLKIFYPIIDFRVWVLIGVIGLSSLLASLGNISWTAWMSEMVPENIRGAYFGKRNMICSGFGMVAVLLGGKFISTWQNRFPESNPFGFMILFSIGLLAGISATWYLSSIPEIKKQTEPNKAPFKFSIFTAPLKDKNFLALILFVSAWQFSIQFAAPFYGIFMIETLKINFSNIAFFGTFATLSTLLMMKIWGPISDNLGNKPILIITSLILAIIPFIWISAVPSSYYTPLLMAHILSGACLAGATLSQFNIVIKFSPSRNRSIYLALFSAITSFFGAIAPMIGSVLAKATQDITYTVLSYPITSLHFIFLASALLQLITLFFIFKVNEPKAASPIAVAIRLKNDLNPQTGIIGTTDFVILNIEKTGNILKQLDEQTERLADKSEEQIEKLLDKGEKVLQKPLKKVKKFLQEND